MDAIAHHASVAFHLPLSSASPLAATAWISEGATLAADLAGRWYQASLLAPKLAASAGAGAAVAEGEASWARAAVGSVIVASGCGALAMVLWACTSSVVPSLETSLARWCASEVEAAPLRGGAATCCWATMGSKITTT